MGDEKLSAPLAWGARIVIGVLTATALQYTVYFGGNLATGIWERQRGTPIVYGGSPLWLLLWLGILVAIFWRAKPRLFDWAAPFSLWVGFWLLGAVATSWHPDTWEESKIAAFSQAMFFTCSGIWGIAMLLLVVHWVFSRVIGNRRVTTYV